MASVNNFRQQLPSTTSPTQSRPTMKSNRESAILDGSELRSSDTLAEADAATRNPSNFTNLDRTCLVATSAARLQQATAAVADRGGILHGVARHHHLKHWRPDHCRRPARRSAQHE